MKIAVLISGGVDSSVALEILKQEKKHDLTAFYIKIWLEDELSFLGECPWEQDLLYIKKICQKLNIPLKIVSLQKEYWSEVVSYTLTELKAGRTPSPDILCNNKIKFGAFFKHITSNFDKIATGHYAQIEEKNNIFHLKQAPDPIKDQTYFLSYLNQNQLSKAIFPIGHLAKSEVRILAEKFNLPNKTRKDSQGICFLGKIKFREFVKQHLGVIKGKIIELETGKTLGEHDGFYFYTIGQRQGIKLGGGPWYVVKKDIKQNIIYISHQYDKLSQARDTFKVRDINWITGQPPTKTILQVKLRHGPEFYTAQLKYFKNGKIKVIINQPDQGIAPGQFTIFYDGKYCLGGGIIEK